jgi:hypothetical protein
MVQTIDSAEEQQLVEAVRRANDLVEGGMAPDQALAKVAREEKFGPGKIRLVAHAYNTGRQLGQWQSGGNVLDKLASYPLADPEKVIADLYGGEKKASERLPDEYASPPDRWWKRPAREKAAREMPPLADRPAPYPRDSMAALHRAYGAVQRHQQMTEEWSRRAAAAADRVRHHVGGLVHYFKKTARDRLPFAAVEQAARTYFGNAAPPLLDLVYSQAHLREKRAAAGLTVQKSPLDLESEPFSSIRACIQAAEDCVRARQALAACRTKEATVREEAFRPFVQASGPRPPGPQRGSDKAAADIVMFNTPIAATAGSMVSRLLENVPQTKKELLEDIWLELEDPTHRNELRKIRSHAMLTRFMTDPDDPISGYDPDKVLQAYNEISQVAPRVADNAALLRPVLHRRLAGLMEPFEAKELADTERIMAQSRDITPFTKEIASAPKSVLG